MQVKKKQFELDMEQRAGSKLEKDYSKTVYCYPVYLIHMQRTSSKMLSRITYKLLSRLPGDISTTSDMQMIPLGWQKVKRN